MKTEQTSCVLAQRLARSDKRGTRRHLRLDHDLDDFASNDYLGLSQLTLPEDRAGAASGATGSRLLSGNSIAAEELEEKIRRFHQADSALLFNSGYAANLGLYSSLPGDKVEVFYDELVHASVKDGLKLARVRAFPFRHNDLEHLRHRLQRARQPAFVSVEAIYSMRGDAAPLQSLAELCNRFGARLIVDEAHSAGIYGEKGEGLVAALGLQEQIFARLITYGKAFGCQGASIIGPKVLKEYLVNFAHSLIYSTALPPAALATISRAYDKVAASSSRQELFGTIKAFRRRLLAFNLERHFFPSMTAIQICSAPHDMATELASHLRRSAIAVSAIRSPTVRRGQECLRICLHSFNTHQSIENLLDCLHSHFESSTCSVISSQV